MTQYKKHSTNNKLQVPDALTSRRLPPTLFGWRVRVYGAPRPFSRLRRRENLLLVSGNELRIISCTACSVGTVMQV